MKKIILFIMLIIIVLFGINFIRNFILISNLEKSAKSINLENLYIKETMANRNTTTELFKSDNTILVKVYIDDNLEDTYWKNFNTNEENSFNSNGEKIEFNNMLVNSLINTAFFKSPTILEKIIYSSFQIIKEKDGIITLTNSNIEFSYKKDTGTLVHYTDNQVYDIRYEIEIGNVKKSNISKP